MAENLQKKLKLTKQQEMLCRYYAQNGHNGSAAAISAGYSKKYAKTLACLNFKKPHVLEYLQELEKPVIDKLGVTENWVLALLKNICEANITDYYDMDPGTNKIRLKDMNKLPREKTCAIEFIRATKNGVTIKLVDKKACIISIGKHLGMFKEQPNGNTNSNLMARVYYMPTYDKEDYTNEGSDSE
jgi:phage terminase small subunit